MPVERTAVIADVHANLPAINAFLSYIDAHADITQIWNLGDFLQLGPHPKEVAEIILGDERFVNIAGEAETRLVHRSHSASRVEQIAHEDWTVSQIGPEIIGKLAAIPPMREATIGDRSVLLVHSIEDVPEDVATNWIFVGHKHAQVHSYRGGKAIVNPGSVGCSGVKNTIQFAVVEVRERGLFVSFENQPYDGTTLRADYLTRRVPDSAWILANMHKT